MTKTEEFNTLTQRILGVLEAQAKQIEGHKLLAIGTRNACESEEESRKRQVHSLNVQINERIAELDRYAEQQQALQRLEAEQMALLEKLTNNES